jgi:hypothetical protein
MAYIGNTVQNQGFTPAIDYFNGNGVTVTFTLSRPVASVAQMIVAIDNVIQNPSSAYTVSGNAITFTSAPLSGTNNIWVEYTSLITTYAAISQDPTVIGDITASGGYLSTGDFGNSYIDGTIVDYVTGLGRITVGDADGLAIYNGGTASRTALMTVGATGNLSTTGTLTTSSRGIAKASMPTGSVLQVVFGSTTSLATSTSTSYAVTGLSATITPTSASSKILVFVDQSFQAIGGDAVGYGYQLNFGVQLLRQSTILVTSQNDSGGKYTAGIGTGVAPASGNIALFIIVSMNYLDSPATTSPQTYSTEFAKGTSGMNTIYGNSGAGAYITLMEIAG